MNRNSPYRINLGDRPVRTMRAGGANRRFILLFCAVACIMSILFLANIRDPGNVSPRMQQPGAHDGQETGKSTTSTGSEGEKTQVDLTGHAIAPKLGNETAKAELGRAAWKLFHTNFARFPDKPTTEESEALRQYIHLFQRLYPCGECAEHFGAILKKFPPQVSTRSAAAAWGCHVHNEVNKSLKKELFDCSNIGDFYDCGCAGDEDEEKKKKEGGKKERSVSDAVEEPLSHERKARAPLEMERMGFTQGG